MKRNKKVILIDLMMTITEKIIIIKIMIININGRRRK